MRIVKSEPLYNQVYEVIRQDILSGKIGYGERINEVKISQDLSVSRGPVREAVSRLEQEGLLERDETNYLHVYKPNVQDLADIYQCRMILESFAAKLAAKNMMEKDLKLLRKLLEKSSELINIETTNDSITAQFLDINSEFHHIIVHASMNRRLIGQIDQLRSLIRLYRKFNIHNQERREIAHNQHLEIYSALKERNALLVCELMKKHIIYDMESLKRMFLKEN